MKENKMNKKQIGFIFSLIGGVLWVETLLLIWQLYSMRFHGEHLFWMKILGWCWVVMLVIVGYIYIRIGIFKFLEEKRE